MTEKKETKKSTKFQKGKSGNPAGRPKGRQGKATELAKKFQGALENDAMEVIQAILNKAKDGDMTAAKMVLDRLIPPKKAIDPNAAKTDHGPIVIQIGNLEAKQVKPALEVTPTVEKIEK